MNSSVPWPTARCSVASANTLRKSATPENTADNGTKVCSVKSASRRAIVVLPLPGGPHRTMLARRPWCTMRPIGPAAASRWSCPTTSSNVAGRSRSASGRGACPANRPGWARGVFTRRP